MTVSIPFTEFADPGDPATASTAFIEFEETDLDNYYSAIQSEINQTSITLNLKPGAGFAIRRPPPDVPENTPVELGEPPTPEPAKPVRTR